MSFDKNFGFYLEILQKHKKELGGVIGLDLEIFKGVRKSIKSLGNKDFEYTPARVRFKIPKKFKPNHSIPREINNDIFITLEINDDVVFSLKEDIIDDPFKKLNSVNINLECGDLIASWHLDRQDDQGIPKSIHPLYHMTFGGTYMEESGRNFGNSLIFRTPRISHPPMEFVLSVDFILNHYYSTDNIDIIKDPAYISIINKFKSIFWKPYALAQAKIYFNSLGGDNEPLKFNDVFVNKVSGIYL